VELQRSHTDLLFFLFYAGHGDRLQLTAASLLFERGWRFNIPNQVWLARWPGITPTEKTTEWEEGLYQYFDHRVWRRIPAHFRLHYSELAEKTNVTAEDVNPTSRWVETPWPNMPHRKPTCMCNINVLKDIDSPSPILNYQNSMAPSFQILQTLFHSDLTLS